MKTDTLGFPAKMYTPQNYMDEDSLPIRAVPAPLLVGPDRMDSLSELDVSLTPDKIGKSVGILKRREGPDGDGVRGKVSRRQVRFDTGSESEGCAKAEVTPGHPESRQEEAASPVNLALESAPVGSDSNVQAPTNPSSFFPTDRQDKGPAHGGSRKVKHPRPSRHPGRGAQRARAEEPGDCPLASPEYNTTLALGQELQQLREAGFDARQAIAQQLRKSSVTRQCVEGKVAEGLNVPKDLQRYKGLVSLEVPVDEVLSVAVQEKMMLVRPKAVNKKQADGTEAPDLMIFYNPLELLAETPYLSVEGLPPLKVQAQPKPAASPFDLYRKLRQWEA
ncbi:protein phosphatase 1 regulatory subunit 35 [Mustelus asterias]